MFQAEGPACANAPGDRSLVSGKTGKQPAVRAGGEKMRGSSLQDEAGQAGGSSGTQTVGGL